ncbi:amino acid adenylation domain-containing protein [Streptomyces sp. ITFR-6]|uniref:non-ribosomal peptide synthetase n=1 Tax=Streptomyces sp. ITFR-6 TaxID=3075197 RepID=UPI00288A6E8A|nr:amino acid adenylation domain-containing protein [Streptomyces sp. ITFR-6]WNI32319.1 amino acid adenylation domain-containing protein [Streptomyces sp. ITFR-6]
MRTAPLSFRQEQLWLFDKVSASGAAYGLGFSIRLHGPLDERALELALNDVLERHSVLRSVFPHEHETGVQVVRPQRPVPLESEACGPQGPGEHGARIVRAELRKGFDLNAEGPARFRLLRVSAVEHALVLVTHHLVMDPRSLEVLLPDLAEAYRARRAGQEPSFAGDAAQFGEYASWQRAWVDGEEARDCAEFWQRALAAWENTELPADRPRSRLLDLTSAAASSPLPPELAASVRTLGERLGVPGKDVLLGAFYALLARHTAATDLTVGMRHTVPGPFAPGQLVGDCGNLLPLRLEGLDGLSFTEVVRRTNAVREEAEKHGGIPFKLVLDGLHLDPDPARLPLVQIGFDARTHAPVTASAGGLSMSAEQLDTGASPYELSLETVLDGPEPAVTVRYATALYHESTAQRLVHRYLRLLAAGCASPEASLTSISITGRDERESVLDEWNARLGPYSADAVHQVFQRVAREHKDRVALAARDGETTYGELETRANRRAHRLLELGVEPGTCVPVLVRRGRPFVEAILAVLKAGAAYVPVDLGQPAERVMSILADCDARVVLASEGAEGLLGATGVRVAHMEDDVSGLPATAPDVEVHPEQLAYVIYTSGSTGVPKGVLIEHRNITGFIRTVRDMFGLGPRDRMLQFASVGFDVSVFEIFGALLSGARLYMVDDEERSSIDTIDALMADQRITVIDLPPAIMELLTPERYPDLRAAFVGGEAFSGELTTRWARHCAFTNGYGPTETTVTVVAKLCEGRWAESPPMGRAMSNHRAYVLDEDGGLLPAGAVGELAIAGRGLGRGYLGRPDLTAERFRPDPYGPPGSRMYLTGDLAIWRDNGDLAFLGRADRQVKVRGVRIELGEVEAALQAVPGVARAVADVAVDPHRGTLLVAYVVPEDGTELQLDAVRSALGNRLPPTMIPTVLVPLSDVPLAQSGKVDRRALPAVEFAGLESADDSDLQDSTPTERTVASEVFATLLGTRVAKHVNFFALGGTSLQAIRIAPRVKTVFGVDVPIAEFFSAPTVAGLARIIDDALARESERRDQLASALDLVEGRSDEEIAEIVRSRFGDAS